MYNFWEIIQNFMHGIKRFVSNIVHFFFISRQHDIDMTIIINILVIFFPFSVNNEIVSSIGKGLCVLIGISRNDTPKDVEYM